MSYKVRFYFLLLFSLPLIVLGQVPAPKIEVGPDRISMREQLKVTLTVYGAKYTLDDFPELGGFTRGNRTVKHGEVVIDGKKTEAHFITKSYVPIEGGEFTILPFEIEVNQKPVRFEGKKIWVEDDEEGYADFVGDIDDAELVTECSKKEIFVGEGVKVRVSFYLSNNAGNWQFPADIGNQVETLAKRLKPENSLENRNVISNITARVEYIKGKKYSVYDLFEAVYYPLNNHHIDIPALTLKMSKGTGSESLKTKAQVIKVKELPEHPLREKVPVGILRLRENLEGGKQKATGESFDLRFTLEGQANMGSLNFGKIESDSNLDFFESSVNVQQENGKVAGAKTFVFKVLPKVAGDYDLGKYFNLVYFDIKTARYDTLSAKETILVTGKTIQGKESLKQDIYSGIENLKTDTNDFNVRRFLKVFANFILVFMVMFLIFIWKKKNE